MRQVHHCMFLWMGFSLAYVRGPIFSSYFLLVREGNYLYAEYRWAHDCFLPSWPEFFFISSCIFIIGQSNIKIKGLKLRWDSSSGFSSGDWYLLLTIEVWLGNFLSPSGFLFCLLLFNFSSDGYLSSYSKVQKAPHLRCAEYALLKKAKTHYTLLEPISWVFFKLLFFYFPQFLFSFAKNLLNWCCLCRDWCSLLPHSSSS